MTTTGGARKKFRSVRRIRRKCYCREVDSISYKDIPRLRQYISDRAKIESAYRSGSCAKCHRRLRVALIRARFLAMLPYAPDHERYTKSLLPEEPGEDTVSDQEISKSEKSSDAPVKEVSGTDVAVEKGSDAPVKEVSAADVAVEKEAVSVPVETPTKATGSSSNTDESST